MTEGFNPGKAALADWRPYMKALCSGACTLKQEGREALSISAPLHALQVRVLTLKPQVQSSVV